MPQIYTPQKEQEVLTPFGPPLGYMRLSDDLVSFLNEKVEDHKKDWSPHLVGKVTEETAFTEELYMKVLEEVKDFIFNYCQIAKIRSSAFTEKLNTRDNTYGIEVKSAWYVRQMENEYNPIHLHTGCTLSCVGYLSLPEGIEEEWEEDYKDHHPSHGHIQFVHGTQSKWSSTNLMIKPQVGDFWLFPSDLWHVVYPFKTKGERRSFSMNMSFIETPKNQTEV